MVDLCFATGLSRLLLPNRSRSHALRHSLCVIRTHANTHVFCATRAGNVQAQNDLTQVVVDLGHPSAGSAPFFIGTTATRGSVITANKGAGLYGLLLSTTRLGPLYNESTSTVLPSPCAAVVTSGVACSGGGDQPSTRWAYSQQSKVCETFDYQGCGGNGNNFNMSDACESLCQPSFVHSATIDTELVADGIGVSLLVVTFTSQVRMHTAMRETLSLTLTLTHSVTRWTCSTDAHPPQKASQRHVHPCSIPHTHHARSRTVTHSRASHAHNHTLPHMHAHSSTHRHLRSQPPEYPVTHMHTRTHARTHTRARIRTSRISGAVRSGPKRVSHVGCRRGCPRVFTHA
jgi:hypothetical protein